MPTTRSARSSVLGKRAHHQQDSISSVSTACDQQLQTPDPTPNAKRVRTSTEVVDGEANKENVPPFIVEVATDVSSPRSGRNLRRTTTEFITPSRVARDESLRRASTSIIPSRPATPSEVSPFHVVTPPPTPPTSLLSLHARARALLRPTCNNTTLEVAGRDAERATIRDFMMSFLAPSDMEVDNDPTTTLYISGSPGTGKTALLHATLRSISTDAKIIFVNCMALNSLDALWERLIEDLGQACKSPGRTKKVKGRDAVEALLKKRGSKCLIILDELDHITPTAQSLTTLLALPNAIPAILRLIGIANTHTLTSSSTASSVVASRNVKTLHFAPYSPAQMSGILQSRLRPLYEDDPSSEKSTAIKKFLPPLVLTLLTKKIATTTGDVRSLFGVLRGAIDLAVAAASSAAEDENPLDTPSPAVTPSHILAAIKAYTPSSTTTNGAKPVTSTPMSATSTPSNSEVMVKITNLGLQARLAFLCVLLASKRLEANLSLTTSATSTPSKKSPSTFSKRTASSPSSNSTAVGIDVGQLYTYYCSVLDRSDRGVFEPVSRSEFGDLIGILEGVSLLSLEGRIDLSSGSGARRAFGRSGSLASVGVGSKGKGKGDVKIANGVRMEEVLRGLGITGDTSPTTGVKQEVVIAIWEAEKARLERELKVIEREKNRAVLVAEGFEGASED